MIANERQHRISAAAIKGFKDAIARAEADGPGDGVHPRLHAAMIDGMRSQVEQLQSEVDAYCALRDGKVKRRVLHSLAEIPNVLIEGRIASRLTQRQLADRISVPEQQIQRYEQTYYSGASIERLQEVADALTLTVRKTVDYHIPTTRTVSIKGASHRRRTTKSGGVAMANRSTRKAAASAAGKTLSSKSASKAARAAAASDLAQVANRKTTGRRAATAASKTLRAKGSSKAAKSAAGSDLSQATRKKKP